MLPHLAQFYENKEEPNKSCLLALRSIILKQDQNISETQKYGMPCFCYFKKALCYLWTDKKTKAPYVLLVDGNFINHPALESGSRARMKILPIDSEKDLPIDLIIEILNKAIDIRRKGQ